MKTNKEEVAKFFYSEAATQRDTERQKSDKHCDYLKLRVLVTVLPHNYTKVCMLYVNYLFFLS